MTQSKWSTKFFALKMELEPDSETPCFFKKLDSGQSPKKEDCLVILTRAMFSLFDFLTLVPKHW
jgi:hypothetical protein